MVRNKIFVSVITILVLSGFLTGCFRMQLDTKELQDPIFLSSKAPKEYKRLHSFELTTKGSWTLFGLATLAKPDLSALIKAEIDRQQGQGVVNLTVKTQTTFGDGLIGFIALLGLIYQPRTVVVSGTVVAFNKESGVQPSQSIRLEEHREDEYAVYSAFAGSIVNGKTEIIF